MGPTELPEEPYNQRWHQLILEHLPGKISEQKSKAALQI